MASSYERWQRGSVSPCPSPWTLPLGCERAGGGSPTPVVLSQTRFLLCNRPLEYSRLLVRACPSSPLRCAHAPPSRLPPGPTCRRCGARAAVASTTGRSGALSRRPARCRASGRLRCAVTFYSLLPPFFVAPAAERTSCPQCRIRRRRKVCTLLPSQHPPPRYFRHPGTGSDRTRLQHPSLPMP